MTRTVLLALLPVFIVGCSSNKPAGQEKAAGPVEAKQAAQPASGRNACSLLTLEDVRAVYGSVMEKSKSNVANIASSGPSADVGNCTYEGGDQPFYVATLMAIWSKGAGNPLGSRDAFVESLPAEMRASMAVEKTEFHGAPAVWMTRQLKVFRDGVQLSIVADAASGKTEKETIEILMEKALGRL